jgi:transposase
VSETTLYRWREQFLEGGAARVAGNGTPQKEAREIERVRRAVAKRDQVIGELTIANRLLGKVQRDDIP